MYLQDWTADTMMGALRWQTICASTFSITNQESKSKCLATIYYFLFFCYSSGDKYFTPGVFQLNPIVTKSCNNWIIWWILLPQHSILHDLVTISIQCENSKRPYTYNFDQYCICLSFYLKVSRKNLENILGWNVCKNPILLNDIWR